ncbi:MAG: heavy metal-responsive transcriptional regulator [Arthrobacter sp.]|uniref:heavy metal-responsive transcriptional regulator n=1 Tax=unclassified Arthrobacter TaxID=235627 RepID=UPI001D001106|nr:MULTISPECIES: heavy metal-responsive transcriptional regulator [unclassified Arthrobacter]MCB5281256.1 Mercuric resistance operon regulatory protein [Arthrobacter sp. ES1]WGZ80721.1 heavy metal-responsive transcriptional regulator [Arthrobacter sp. EM1]
MLIGKVSAVTGIDTQTIRFYERQGLLPAPTRAPNGYRVYDGMVVGRLRFVRAAQSAGLALNEIKGVLSQRDSGEAPCAHVAGLLKEKLAEVRGRQQELAGLAAELGRLIEVSRDLDPADCSDADVCQIIAQPPADRHEASIARSVY